jgi:hypothetical protein
MRHSRLLVSEASQASFQLQFEIAAWKGKLFLNLHKRHLQLAFAGVVPTCAAAGLLAIVCCCKGDCVAQVLIGCPNTTHVDKMRFLTPMSC